MSIFHQESELIYNVTLLHFDAIPECIASYTNMIKFAKNLLVISNDTMRVDQVFRVRDLDLP